MNANRATSTAAPAPAGGTRAAPDRAIEPRSVVVRWSITRDAAEPAMLHVAVTRDADGWRAEARITDAPDAGPLNLPPIDRDRASWIVEPESAVEHLDVPGLVHLTFRRSNADGGIDVLFARTDLARRLGVTGGRCELAGAAAQPAPPKLTRDAERV
ncbi:MAG: hypothetical protein ACKVU4_11670 [Phycisphaerales bacterium]